MSLALELAAAGAAAFGAGLVNALAGGGTLISFPTLLALGLSSIGANVTSTVALTAGYLGGALAQRADLRPGPGLRRLVVAAALGGLGGAALVFATGEALFRRGVPYLLLFACLLLVAQEPIKRVLSRRGSAEDHHGVSIGALVAIALASVYGGYFGAGLGVVFFAVLGISVEGTAVQTNALKQSLSLAVNSVAAIFFACSGQVVWRLVPAMAIASWLGGHLGGRLVGRVPPGILRAIVVLAGIAVALRLLLH